MVEETDAISYGEAMRALVPTLTHMLPSEPAHIAEGVISEKYLTLSDGRRASTRE